MQEGGEGLSWVREMRETYRIIRRLACINGPNIDKQLIDRVMLHTERLPLLGSEYWWFLFLGQTGKKPIQLMLLIFRKHKGTMVFDDKKVVFGKLTQKKIRAVTAGWVYDRSRIHDFNVTNNITMIDPKQKVMVSDISGQRLVFQGGFPKYELKIGNSVDLDIVEGDYFESKDAHGILIPPFGAGWINLFLDAEGTILGKEFKGRGYLQKVVGITIFGPWNWGRVFFHNGSSLSFFCIKPGRYSKKYFRRSMTFYDHPARDLVKLKRPKLEISRKGGKTPLWIIRARDEETTIRVVLRTYASKRFIARGIGSQVYNEYAVTVETFKLENKEKTISLGDLGDGGVGTFEDSYGSPL